MQSLPLLVSLGVALVVVPGTVSGLRRLRSVRANYRDAEVAFPAGVAIVASSLVALAPLALASELAAGGVFAPGFETAVTYVLGVALLGLVDDLIGGARHAERAAAAGPGGTPEPRGWRGHARATARGRLSTGALKAAGSLGLALYVLSGQALGAAEYALGVGVLVLTTNFFNLLDLRPGRSVKALLLLALGLTAGSRDPEPLWALGLFLGPILVALPEDLRERAMLGDTGSNAVGAVAGLWVVLTLPVAGLTIALALVAAASAYGEFRSISSLVDRTPLLRELDSLGRVSHA